MRVAFDTSVIVAGIVEAHPAFDVAARWLDAADRGELEAVWTTHAYAECWSVLTRLPLVSRLDPGDADTVLAALVEAHAPEAISLTDYRDAAARCADAGLRSGAIFDALHLVVAERLGADALLTKKPCPDVSRGLPCLSIARGPRGDHRRPPVGYRCGMLSRVVRLDLAAPVETMDLASVSAPASAGMAGAPRRRSGVLQAPRRLRADLHRPDSTSVEPTSAVPPPELGAWRLCGDAPVRGSSRPGRQRQAGRPGPRA